MFYVLLQYHDQLMYGHSTIAMTQIEREDTEGLRSCSIHKRYPVVAGCKLCEKLYCTLCLTNEANRVCDKSGELALFWFVLISFCEIFR